MAMPITTVLCDLDGTLIDSRRDIALAFQHALRHLVEGTLPEEAAIAQHIGKPLEHMARELGYHFAPPQLTLFLETYRSHYTASGARYTRLYPGVTATLHALASLRFGVVTTKAQEQAEAVLRHLHLTSFFQHIQGWVPGLPLKPAPDSIIAALVALGCVIQGETFHFDIVAMQSARALIDYSVAHRLPIGNGILTVDTEAQAWARARFTEGDKGGDAARAALALIELKRKRSQR